MRLPLFAPAVLAALGFLLPAGGEIVEFREPDLRAYAVDVPAAATRLAAVGPEWLTARPLRGGTNSVQLGRRVALRAATAAEAAWLAERHGLKVARQFAPGTFILEAADAPAALRAARTLAATPGVAAAVPVMRRHRVLHSPWTPMPDDPYFDEAWHLDNRGADGRRQGLDLNVRAAWAVTRGEGVTVAVVDDGFERHHPDLSAAAAGAPHFDFTNAGATPGVYGEHGTAVAGIIGAHHGSGVGAAGVAGAARLASWPVFNLRGDITDDEALADMFRHQAQTVAVQNHSWGNSGEQLGSPSLLEQAALDDVLANGRGGRGVVIVRSGGNSRELGGNVNYDSYPSDPRVIAVAAIREDGRAASYSNPGACLLLGAPSGDQQDDFSQGRTIFTTDRVGSSAGYNQISFADDRADYAFGAFGFSGTSAAAPMISGVAALMLSVNTNLTVRDVQQVLIHAARQPGAADPTRQTNGAGHVASHNAGFGVPDAWQAVDLARRWSNRPPVTERRRTWAGDVFIPDDGLRVVATVDGVEFSHRCQPALGRHPEATTADLPLASVGRALTPPAADLRGRAALIERGGNFFYEKINHVAAAGAALAVIFNNVNAAEVFVPGGTDWTDIPAVMIGEDDGRALLAAVEAGSTVSLRLNVEDARLTFDVPDTLVLEHVGLRVRTTHQRRGDLRITLVSPAGTRSVLQALGSDFEAGPDDWTFWSTQHFYEGSAGLWTAQFVDEDSGPTGSVTELELILRGVAITDADRDGLDDAWERRWFGGLAQGPRDDPDGDGSWNAREQALGTDPTRADRPFAVELARHDATRWRLTWPARDGDTNQVRGGSSVIGPGLLETVTGRFPETEAIVPADGAQGFFQVSR